MHYNQDYLLNMFLNSSVLTDVIQCYRLSKKLRDGTLTEDDDLPEGEDIECENVDDDKSIATYQNNIYTEVEAVVKVLELDQWVVVWYKDEWFPGVIEEVIITFPTFSKFS